MRTILCALTVTIVTGAAGAQVASLGDLSSGATAIGNISGGTIAIGDASFWDFWTFSANAGDLINIEVDRLAGGLDPASSVVFGNATGIPFASLTGFDVFTWSGPGLSIVLASGDDDDPPAIPGPFGDPNYAFAAPSTGVYTVAVASFLSTLPFPGTGYDYNITVTGSTIPAPGALALLGMAGLCTIRRRRA
jgi:MYXO-CTERM domain-containing protein